jgi:hypothetical protein
MAFDFGKKGASEAAPAPSKAGSFNFGSPRPGSAAQAGTAPVLNPCPKCGREMATGGTTRLVCLHDGTTKA